MNPTPPPTRLPLRMASAAAALLLILALLPAAAAAPVASGQLRAGSVNLANAATQSATVRLLHLHHDALEAPDTSPLGGTFTAVKGQLDWYHEEQYVWMAQGVDGQQPDPGQADPSTPAKSYSINGGSIGLAPAQPGYRMNGWFASGAAVTTSTSSVGLGGLSHATANQWGISESESGDATEADQPDDQMFTRFRVDRPVLLGTIDAASTTLTLRGDGVLEVSGLDITLTDASGAVTTVHTGTSLTPVQTGPNGDGIYRMSTDFARITVTTLDGSLELASPAGVLQWAADQVSAISAGVAHINEAGGTLREPDGHEQTLAASDLRLEGRNDLELQALGKDMLDIQLTGYDADGRPYPALRASLTRPDDWILAVIGVFVALAALAFAAMAMLLHARRAPSQAEVESALVRGQYERAASMAGRILRSKPGLEDAVISRAIALAKQGQPARVVAELTAHIGRKDPSDGVVHYVLGLAYLDLGKKDQARKALQEAVRRTPALLPEANSRLGQPIAPASPSPERLEAHGYA